jgi:hypothetical protein
MVGTPSEIEVSIGIVSGTLLSTPLMRASTKILLRVATHSATPLLPLAVTVSAALIMFVGCVSLFAFLRPDSRESALLSGVLLGLAGATGTICLAFSLLDTAFRVLLLVRLVAAMLANIGYVLARAQKGALAAVIAVITLALGICKLFLGGG